MAGKAPVTDGPVKVTTDHIRYGVFERETKHGFEVHVIETMDGDTPRPPHIVDRKCACEPERDKIKASVLIHRSMA